MREKLTSLNLVIRHEDHTYNSVPTVLLPFENLKRFEKNFPITKKFVKDNFEYVGENFTYKARSIHYDKKKPKKGIYGSASLKDVKELREEGIDTDIIPWIDDDKN